MWASSMRQQIQGECVRYLSAGICNVPYTNFNFLRSPDAQGPRTDLSYLTNFLNYMCLWSTD